MEYVARERGMEHVFSSHASLDWHIVSDLRAALDSARAGDAPPFVRLPLFSFLSLFLVVFPLFLLLSRHRWYDMICLY